MMTGEEFEVAYLKYAPELWRFAARQLNSGDLAHDMVQDLFAYVWENRSKTVVRESLKAYLFTILRRRIIDQIRHDSAITIVDQDSAAEIPLDSITDEIQLTEEFIRILEKAPPQHRELLTLRWYHNLSYAEIAEVLGISIPAAQKQVSRSLAALGPLLKKIF